MIQNLHKRALENNGKSAMTNEVFGIELIISNSFHLFALITNVTIDTLFKPPYFVWLYIF